MTSPTDPQVPSAERREEVKALWQHHRSGNMAWLDAEGFWRFIAALDAQSAERTRAEVEKMRERAISATQEECADTEDGETLEALNRVIERLRALPIEGTSP